jgi:hydroxyacylglutathione hydrolase
METEKIVTGLLDENCYVLKKNGTCLVVDPGDDYHKIKDVVGDDKVLAVLLTHSHFDHIGALRNFLTKRSVKIFKKSSVEEKEYQIGDFSFQVIYTPGHSKDSISFYFKEEKLMFVGDFVFKESIGRCDLPGGSEEEMQESLSKIKGYPVDVTLYPGHGDATTLDYEFSHNPYLS